MMTHSSITSMRRRSAARDSSPNAPACRSRRGEASKGSSLFRPGVEARSAEDPGKEDPEKYIRPRQGVALVRESSNQCDALAGSRSPAMPDPRVVGAAPPRPVAKRRAPLSGVHRSSLFTVSGVASVTLKRVSPVVPSRRDRSATSSGLECHPTGTGVLPHRDCSSTPSGLESLPQETVPHARG